MLKFLSLFLIMMSSPAIAATAAIYSGMTIDGTTLSLGANNNVQMNGLNPAASQTAVNGTAGSYTWSMPVSGSSYKLFIVYFSGYTNAGTSAITFPTAFTNTPQVEFNGTSLVIGTISTTGMTIPIGTGISGYMTVVGY